MTLAEFRRAVRVIAGTCASAVHVEITDWPGIVRTQRVEIEWSAWINDGRGWTAGPDPETVLRLLRGGEVESADDVVESIGGAS